ncbi:hypothetical protein HY967_04850 [Candidatus Jorgensenbacteria bacterium]|nr:hypothetical protein [Candidatus Jorgensenbacteria bacterium]
MKRFLLFVVVITVLVGTVIHEALAQTEKGVMITSVKSRDGSVVLTPIPHKSYVYAAIGYVDYPAKSLGSDVYERYLVLLSQRMKDGKSEPTFLGSITDVTSITIENGELYGVNKITQLNDYRVSAYVEYYFTNDMMSKIPDPIISKLVLYITPTLREQMGPK